MAWISARHPSTFSGPSRCSSSLLTRRCFADFRLLLAGFCLGRTESVHRLVFCLIAMFMRLSKKDANKLIHSVTFCLQDSYALGLRLANQRFRPFTSHFREAVIPFLGSQVNWSTSDIPQLFLVSATLRRGIGESHRKTSTTPAYGEWRAKRLAH